jgi:hypothetical protein
MPWTRIAMEELGLSGGLGRERKPAKGCLQVDPPTGGTARKAPMTLGVDTIDSARGKRHGPFPARPPITEAAGFDGRASPQERT